MPNEYLVQVFWAVGALIGFGVVWWLFRHSGKRSEQRQRIQRVAAGAMIVLFSPLLYYTLFIAGEYQIAGLLLSVLAVMLYAALRPQNQADIATNYGLEPGRCGQCGYDLRGTTGPMCPECGWNIPSEPLPFQRPDWASWWRRWHIDHLNHWKVELCLHLLYLPLFVILPVWVWPKTPVFAVLIGLLTLHYGINAIRVVQYAWGRRSDSVVPARQKD